MYILIHIFSFVYNQALRAKEKKYKHWGKSKDHTAVQILWQRCWNAWWYIQSIFSYGCFESSSLLSLQEYAYWVTLCYWDWEEEWVEAKWLCKHIDSQKPSTFNATIWNWEKTALMIQSEELHTCFCIFKNRSLKLFAQL